MKKFLCVLLMVCLFMTTFSVFASAHVTVPCVLVLNGDLNGDNTVNMKDLLMLRKVISGEMEASLVNADLNNDGMVNMNDLLQLRITLAYRSNLSL